MSRVIGATPIVKVDRLVNWRLSEVVGVRFPQKWTVRGRAADSSRSVFWLLRFLSLRRLLPLSSPSLFPPPSTFTMLRSIPRQLQRRPLRAITPSRFALRSFTCGYPRMSLPPVQPPVSTTLPSDAFQLLSTPEKAGSAEDALYEQQIRDVEAWWNSPRYEGIKRPYSAADVVSKRGSLQQTYPSSLMARKLFNLLNERAAAGEPVHTSKSDFARALDRTGLTLFNSGCH